MRRAAQKRRREARRERSFRASRVGAVIDVRRALGDLARACKGRSGLGGSEEAELLLEAVAGADRRLTSAAVSDLISSRLSGLWEKGWQPAELYRAARRFRSEVHEDLARVAVSFERESWGPGAPPEWTAQVDEMPWWGSRGHWLEPWTLHAGVDWIEALEAAVEVLALVSWLPGIETLLPPPSRWAEEVFVDRRATRVDEAVLEKIRALLAKAESTGFEHEADALTAKAQELMARHAIDEALMNAAAGCPPNEPIGRRIFIDNPYARAKLKLINVIGKTNGVRCVWTEDLGFVTAVGFPADIDSVDMLFTSLLMQASKAMLSHGPVTDRTGRSRTRSFRNSFLIAFASRIGERLEAAVGQARVEAEREVGRDLLPVLAGRRDDVDRATERLFPRLQRMRGGPVTNYEGWIAGRVAAEKATLGPERGCVPASTG